MEKRYIRKDGRLLWGLLAVSLVRDSDGRPAYFVSQIEDITDRKQAELAAASIRQACGGTVPSLSPRETEVLGLLADGMLTSEAAAQLGIGEETVQTLVRRAMRKLGARNRTQAVANALRLRLLDPAQ
jgi:DNA-binding CsgD family transcriptional regulator